MLLNTGRYCAFLLNILVNYSEMEKGVSQQEETPVLFFVSLKSLLGTKKKDIWMLLLKVATRSVGGAEEGRREYFCWIKSVKNSSQASLIAEKLRLFRGVPSRNNILVKDACNCWMRWLEFMISINKMTPLWGGGRTDYCYVAQELWSSWAIGGW